MDPDDYNSWAPYPPRNSSIRPFPSIPLPSTPPYLHRQDILPNYPYVCDGCNSQNHVQNDSHGDPRHEYPGETDTPALWNVLNRPTYYQLMQPHHVSLSVQTPQNQKEADDASPVSATTSPYVIDHHFDSLQNPGYAVPSQGIAIYDDHRYGVPGPSHSTISNTHTKFRRLSDASSSYLLHDTQQALPVSQNVSPSSSFMTSKASYIAGLSTSTTSTHPIYDPSKMDCPPFLNSYGSQIGMPSSNPGKEASLLSDPEVRYEPFIDLELLVPTSIAIPVVPNAGQSSLSSTTIESLDNFNNETSQKLPSFGPDQRLPPQGPSILNPRLPVPTTSQVPIPSDVPVPIQPSSPQESPIPQKALDLLQKHFNDPNDSELKSLLQSCVYSSWLRDHLPEDIDGLKKESVLLPFLTREDTKSPWKCLFCLEDKLETVEEKEGKKGLQRKDRALAHVRMHLGHRPFDCPGAEGCGLATCKKRFVSVSQLKSHTCPIMVTCDICKKELAKKNIVRHKKTCGKSGRH